MYTACALNLERSHTLYWVIFIPFVCIFTMRMNAYVTHIDKARTCIYSVCVCVSDVCIQFTKETENKLFIRISIIILCIRIIY